MRENWDYTPLPPKPITNREERMGYVRYALRMMLWSAQHGDAKYGQFEGQPLSVALIETYAVGWKDPRPRLVADYSLLGRAWGSTMRTFRIKHKFYECV